MKVFYRPEQVATNASARSPSAFKPKQVVEDWLACKLIQPEDIHSFEPVSRVVLKGAHNAEMVDDLLDLKIANGFGNFDTEVAESLPYTSGSMLSAAKWALVHRKAVCSPTSGFHHAGFRTPDGYCSFNGLMVTAVNLLQSGQVRSVAILDCDAHYGNGTDDIIDHLKLRDKVRHHTMGQHFEMQDSVGENAVHFFAWLQAALSDCIQTDLVIYQAGADAHIHDPLGGFLASEEMRQRDMMVFAACKHVPLVWNLAGGYQRSASGGIEPVLELHRITLRACIECGAS